ncbi:P-loop containing nucleoside triphosphate hydrolase protein, partial [Blyttiomyces helicus]
GCLLSGKPGTGKTVLAKAFAGMPEAFLMLPRMLKFLSLIAAEGDSELHLWSIFAEADRDGPSIIILDEFDIIATKRTGSRASNEPLRLDFYFRTKALTGSHLPLALTNRLHAVDSDILRCGRLDDRIDIEVKDAAQRYRILDLFTSRFPISTSDREAVLKEAGRMTHGFVGSDLESLCHFVMLEKNRQVRKAEAATARMWGPAAVFSEVPFRRGSF